MISNVHVFFMCTLIMTILELYHIPVWTYICQFISHLTPKRKLLPFIYGSHSKVLSRIYLEEVLSCLPTYFDKLQYAAGSKLNHANPHRSASLSLAAASSALAEMDLSIPTPPLLDMFIVSRRKKSKKGCANDPARYFNTFDGFSHI